MEDLNLLEADYFGIQYKDREGNLVYLDPLKKIKSQIKNINNTVLQFVVKFFPPDPGQLQEEYTRYLFALQVKQDISAGLLPSSDQTMISMASYMAQADFGDWNSSDCSDPSYLRDINLLPPTVNPNDQELLINISETHRQKMGKSPADADFQLLDIARHLEHYGLRLHTAKDQENTEISLAVANMGVVVFRGNAKINTFNWARIRKLSFKKKRFLIKLRTEANTNNVGDILVFVMASRNTCKNFWRHCIEYHAFFRLEIHPERKPQPMILKRGSTFRYSGKTQKQLHELVRNSNFRRTAFVRMSSRKPGAKPKRHSFDATPSFRPPVVENGSKVEVMTHEANVDIPSPISHHSEPREHHIPEYSGVSPTDDHASDEGQKPPSPYETPHDPPPTSQQSPSYMAAQAWQVESEHLHSSVASSHAEPRDRHAEEQAAGQPSLPEHGEMAKDRQPSTSQGAIEDEQPAVPSPVHLHSGGVHEVSTATPDLTTVSALSMTPNLSTAASTPSNISSQGVLSTRDLKSTSSLSDTRYPSSQAYYIAKEILQTERTYVSDLDVIYTWFKGAIQKDGDGNTMLPGNVANQLFGDTGSLLDIHQQFLDTLEAQLSMWEGRGGGGDQSRDQNVDDVLLNHVTVLKKHLPTLENGEVLISALEEVGLSEPRFEYIYREFEIQKVCYLPFNAFLLKPMQRIVHYKTIFERLLNHYSHESSPSDHSKLETALQEMRSLATATQERLKKALQLQKMSQLRRDLIGVDFLLKQSRSFIREGSLYKLSRKGFQQRLFFLFSDCLLYTSKGVTTTNQFKVHAEMPLAGMVIEINEGESAVPNCFSILSASKTVIVAAANQAEMDKWLEDFGVAIANANRVVTPFESPLSNNARSSMSRLSMEQSSEDGDCSSVRSSTERLKQFNQQRSNATMHVCWHRNTSVSYADHLVSLKNQLSGYLLRKFKNSNAWQKLWVTFTNFCLFFYKSNQDESPLASLPLLGYTINSPSPEDNIRKDYVFKLQFKTHVYFFRAESLYTYDRWIEVVSSATVASQRTRLFSRMDSNQAY
uniref:FERM, RhoGEF and pleckstrin domain-containing protein 1-like n=1 Tax=Phallusia mammillata TaxID=59560 RepID=A0A6F9DDA7_9ASCI|nr:FERM, RhoGEF and pleckstrin domain-containing protein 1-like [Phallusia mammillata]